MVSRILDAADRFLETLEPGHGQDNHVHRIADMTYGFANLRGLSPSDLPPCLQHQDVQVAVGVHPPADG